MATAKNEVAVKQKAGIASYMARDDVKQSIINVIGEQNLVKFTSSIVSAVQTTPALQECTNASILSSALLGEALKLSPSPQLGMYYLVPYDSKRNITDPNTGRTIEQKIKEAQFQLGWKGYLQLAIRTGQYRKIVVSEVKQGEVQGYNPITEEFQMNPVIDVAERIKLPTMGYYAAFELINGFKKEIYWSKEDMEAHAKQYSKAYANDLKKGWSYSFWTKNFDDMAKKTLIRQLISKWGIMSIDMERAFSNDMAVIREDGTPDYVDNRPDDPYVAQDIYADKPEEVETIDAEYQEVESQQELSIEEEDNGK